MQSFSAQRIRSAAIFAAGEAMIICLIIPVAFWLGQNFEFFPRNIIPIWVLARPEDVLPTMQFMGGSSLLVFFCSQLLFGASLPSGARRAAIEVYAFAVAVTIGSVSMFFFSMAVFDPEFLVGIAGLGVLALCAAHAVSSNLAKLSNWKGLLAAFWDVIANAFGLLKNLKTLPYALAVIAFTSTPILLAYKFKSDREFADAVTEFRMSLLPDIAAGAKYKTVAAYPGLKFLQPMKLRFDPNDPNRAFLLERAGKFYTFNVDDPIESRTLLLDLSEDVKEVYLETGAQGFAFHPDFEFGTSIGKNDIFFYYTSYTAEAQTNYLISVDLSLPTVEDRYNSKFHLVELGGEANASHNGGELQFGPDGFLYFSVGDRLSFENHQNLERNLNGGLFRIDVDQQGGNISAPPKRQPTNSKTAGYYIPLDNPLVGQPNAVEEFFAWGLRNPFRYEFDSEGRIWAGEVGAATWEEVNIIQKGGNYQWPFAEGYLDTETPRPDPFPGVEVEPVFNYVHNAYDRAIIGGFVVEDAKLRGLEGRYIFGDNFSGNLFAIDASGTRVEQSEIIGRVDQYAQRGLTSFAMSPDGEILVTTMGGRLTPEGEILKLVIDDGTITEDESSSDQAPALVASAEIGFERFNDNCSTCHGASAVVTMIELGHNMPDFSDPDYQASRTDEELYDIVKLGGGRLGVSEAMPPWEMILSDEEIESIVLYLREMEQ